MKEKFVDHLRGWPGKIKRDRELEGMQTVRREKWEAACLNIKDP